ncbi:MAG: adenylate/guanylate cyclase domain-containing protein, partial [Verrucomicrobiota bacterium]|nr:adenylate/guanylate cyclase domain-containing protein [Verrucomicrobiota bacterium]
MSNSIHKAKISLRNTPVSIITGKETDKKTKEISYCLQKKGMLSRIINISEESIMRLENEKPAFILLSPSLNTESMKDIYLKIRGKMKTIPVMVITTEENKKDIIDFLDFKNGDMIVEPFVDEEIHKRIEAKLEFINTEYELNIANTMLKELNNYLESAVDTKSVELQSVNRLRKFFSPQLVDAIILKNSNATLREHRSEISVVFLDLRNFTSFAEHSPPENVLRLIRDFHQTIGPIINKYKATIERFSGDGVMIFLGDPDPMPDHPIQALKMSLEIMLKTETKYREWHKWGYEDGLGIGIDTGDAAIGIIGFEERYDYAAL